MKKNIDRSTIEQLKLELQEAIQNVLTCMLPVEDEAKIISRAMAYIVTSHNSFEEQYYRIKEYLLIMESLQERCLEYKPLEPPVNANIVTPQFPQKQFPF